MNRLVLIILAVLSVPAFTEPTQACQCREYGTPICAEFWRSDAVFVGQVVGIKPIPKKPDNVYTYVIVSFRVKEAFRGVDGQRVGVGVATNTLCEPKFKMGKQYLVYASLDANTNQLFTGMCRRTTLAVDIDEDLNELRKLSQRQVGQSISGRIKTNRYEGLAGIAVEVISHDKTLTTMTTKSGVFSISLPSPGSFKVRVSMPYAAQLMDSSDDHLSVRSTQTERGTIFEYDVTLEKSQCSYLELDTR